MTSYILVLKGYDKLNIIVGFIFGGIVLLIGNFLVGSMIRYITSSTVIPENYNLYVIITVGLVVVCGSALGILLGMFTGEPAKETLDGRLDI
jgi:Co/Zn/Cd efflux system component